MKFKNQRSKIKVTNQGAKIWGRGRGSGPGRIPDPTEWRGRSGTRPDPTIRAGKVAN